MELWIRSQDRENTVKINRQYGLHWKDKTMIIADYQPDFVGTEGEYYELLGTYESKERALEVLDEINEIKYYKYMANLDWDSFVNSVIKPKTESEQKQLLAMMNTYKMPKE